MEHPAQHPDQHPGPHFLLRPLLWHPDRILVAADVFFQLLFVCFLFVLLFCFGWLKTVHHCVHYHCWWCNVPSAAFSVASYTEHSLELIATIRAKSDCFQEKQQQSPVNKPFAKELKELKELDRGFNSFNSFNSLRS